MTPAEIAEALQVAREARERAEKATPAPWTHSNVLPPELIEIADCFGFIRAPRPAGSHHLGPFDVGQWRARAAVDAPFIAAARTDVPVLAALVERMAEDLARLPSAERLAEMRARAEDALDSIYGFPLKPDHENTIRLLAEDLSDLLDAIAPRG